MGNLRYLLVGSLTANMPGLVFSGHAVVVADTTGQEEQASLGCYRFQLLRNRGTQMEWLSQGLELMVGILTLQGILQLL